VVHGQYRREFNARLLEFLRIELDVIATLIDKAKITRWAKSRQQSLDASKLCERSESSKTALSHPQIGSVFTTALMT